MLRFRVGTRGSRVPHPEGKPGPPGSGVESAVCLRPACGLQLRGVGASAQKPGFQFCLPGLQSPSTPLATRARGQIPEFSVSSVFPGASDGKESAYIAGDLGSIPGSEKSPGGGHGNPLQYSGLENSMDRGAWWTAVHGVARSQP